MMGVEYGYEDSPAKIEENDPYIIPYGAGGKKSGGKIERTARFPSMNRLLGHGGLGWSASRAVLKNEKRT